MTEYQFQVLVTRLNLIIDLLILQSPAKPSVQLSETSYQIEAQQQVRTVVTQPDADVLVAIDVAKAVRRNGAA